MDESRTYVSLLHLDSDRIVPVEVPTVFGRSDDFYRYQSNDQRHDRLDMQIVDRLEALNYVQICSDNDVSRTHGLVDPRVPGVSDLNSTNGTKVNGMRLEQHSGRPGPVEPLENGDEIEVGEQKFRVQIQTETVHEIRERVGKLRRAMIGFDAAHAHRALQVRDFLVARKGFPEAEVRQASGWSHVINELYRLQTRAHSEGIAVCTIHAGIHGDQLVLDGVSMPIRRLLPLLADVHGRKILVLDTDADPKIFETIFAAEAYEDMILLTTVGEVSLADPMRHSNRSDLVNQVRESISGKSTPGVIDGAIDGLDELIAADSNIINVAWVQHYEGRLGVMFGEREHGATRMLTHTLRRGSTTFRF